MSRCEVNSNGCGRCFTCLDEKRIAELEALLQTAKDACDDWKCESARESERVSQLSEELKEARFQRDRALARAKPYIDENSRLQDALDSISRIAMKADRFATQEILRSLKARQDSPRESSSVELKGTSPVTRDDAFSSDGIAGEVMKPSVQAVQPGKRPYCSACRWHHDREAECNQHEKQTAQETSVFEKLGKLDPEASARLSRDAGNDSEESVQGTNQSPAKHCARCNGPCWIVEKEASQEGDENEGKPCPHGLRPGMSACLECDKDAI